ncbi:hypothetical protein [Pseudomonas baetica]|uniref:hypothetical protein n=1 Tax=Pseudomonas baetica TaxID=674054 RepID=UPI002405CDB2|nr:hypothetical protein [Pseudomonas baetica]MDF9778915.1 hypothetical protein [Pseudomonas baetica]
MTSTLPAAPTTHSAQDHQLTAQGLQAVYSDADEHPLYTRGAWRASVASGDTSLGYWDWAKETITFAHDNAAGANAAVVLRQKARQLRGLGYAVIMFSPEELINVCASELEEHLTERGNQYLAERQGK